MTTIADMEADVARLELELKVAKATLYSARMVVAGVQLGDIVVGKGRFAGKNIRVTKVDLFSSGKAWVSGNPQRADGSFGTAVRNIYDHWERVS